MSEHWKSTPKYYCKHCLTYVRDTKLERANHEATGKHQGAVRRALTNLHRAANNEVRERERAKREIDRLNGVVSNTATTTTTTTTTHAASSAGGAAEKQERTRQAEQLAALGVALPQQFRGELAMPGEWSVTSTTVVEEDGEDNNKSIGDASQAAARARGVHKRERTEEQLEHEAAVKGLFKKSRRWGRDGRGMAEGSEDLDALLSGELVVKKDGEEGEVVKKEEEKQEEEGDEVLAKDQPEARGVKKEEDLPAVKKEPEVETDMSAAEAKRATLPSVDEHNIKTEDGEGPSEAADVPVITFKKRKPKNIRQK